MTHTCRHPRLRIPYHASAHERTSKVHFVRVFFSISGVSKIFLARLWWWFNDRVLANFLPTNVVSCRVVGVRSYIIPLPVNL